MSGYSIPIGFPFDGGIGQSGSSSPPGPPPGPPPPLPTGTLSLFAMDMDTPTEQGQLLTTSGSRQERVSLPFSNAESMSLLNPTSMNGQNQHYDSGGGGMSTASAGALLSDFEQQAFSEFLNRISSTDDFSMLMDSSWFSNGPFASLNSATTTPPTTNSNDNINNSLDLKAISIGSSAMPSTPNDMPTPMHPLTYSVTSAELAQLNLPISSALTTIASADSPDIGLMTNIATSNSNWSPAHMNSLSPRTFPSITIASSVANDSTTNQVLKSVLAEKSAITTAMPQQPFQQPSQSDPNSLATTNYPAVMSELTPTKGLANSTKSKQTMKSNGNNSSGGIRKGRRSSLRPTSPLLSLTVDTPSKTTRLAPGPSPTSRPGATLGRPKKPAHELLTDSEKKANHIASEQKRRQNIRVGFASLTTMVPTLSQCSRSEALILQKSVEYIRQLVQQRRDMAQRIHELRNKLGEPQIELPGDNEDFLRNMGLSGISGSNSGSNSSTSSHHGRSPVINSTTIGHLNIPAYSDHDTANL